MVGLARIAMGRYSSSAIVRNCLRRGMRGVVVVNAALAIALITIDASSAADTVNCNGEFAQIQGDRRDVAARGNDVAAAIEQFETCARQNAATGKVPDSCRSQADDYQKAVTRLNVALDSADRRVRLIGVSCAQPPVDGTATSASAPPAVPSAPLPPTPPPRAAAQPVVVAPPPPPPPMDASCETARSYKGKIPFEGVVKICLRTLSEADCRVCLGPLGN
jgi:hypothetical protein